MCNRNIGESVHSINDIQEYMDENDKEAILFSANFGKAFDLVEHSSNISTLRTFGFGPDFNQWVKTFFKNVESCVMNNGRSTGYSPRKRHPTRRSCFCIPSHFGPQSQIIQIRENADIRDVRGGSFLTMKAAETLCIVCLLPEEYISLKNIWVTDLPKHHIL